MKSNFKNTICCPLRFLALSSQSSRVKNEAKWLYCPLVTKDNKVAFEIKYAGEKTLFYPEQIVGMLLQKLKQTLNLNNLKDNAIVLSVPGYFTQQERLSLLVSSKIAGISLLRLMNESTAGKKMLFF
jgi:molecular chaperone DnaK (HSP70)